MADQNGKPGIKTTEFWATIITAGATILFTTGVLTKEQSDVVQETGSQLAEHVLSAIGLLGSALMVFGYNAGRAKVKAAEVEAKKG